MAEDKLKLHIVTPDRSLINDYIERIIFKTTEGDIAILYDHIPLTTVLTSGKAYILKDNETKVAVLHDGFAEITEEGVTILAEAAEWPEEIDINRAREAKRKAEEVLESSHYHYRDATHARIHVSLSRALTRIEAYEDQENSNE